ncbi:YobI family P-loop NTPase [Leifsonia poae]|uniref:YobI family P-loop NTPase n=1 Tax=Leifsonia poae TaxID=110933 RepID=UPI001CBE7D51|nr:hypothetical protein [Leifsonia poae]
MPDDVSAVDGAVDAHPESAVDDRENGTQANFSIHSLRPVFEPAHHEIYVEYLEGELNKPAHRTKHANEEVEDEDVRPHNIALTGSYGSGKSSILSKVLEDLSNRVVSVSLSTLGSEETIARDESAKTDPLATPAITNAIQKEIVKQLLYREKPSSVPGSRYRRIESFRRGRAFGISVLLAAALTAIALLTGATSRVQAIFGNDLWPTVLIYVGVFILVLAMTQGLQALFHNRVWIEKLTSGPASITLTNSADSFFDQYLDELVYFFEANPYDVVLFEDLDRFNDPYIFETLRELNTLLNNSKQIDPRRITFVYAIKDSIFEQLGKLSINGVKLSDEEIRQLAVTNRTKFFDVVIPVVPFISHHNARDLISKEMKASGFQIQKPLLDLVSKHLVDMRLIKNIHNEFGVFEQKILAPGHLDELDPQPLFAMIVYKNLSMTDFEKVKDGTSQLDRVWGDFRKLVNFQIATAESQIRRARSRSRKLELMESRADRLGDQLEEYMSRLMRSVGQTLDQGKLSLATAITLPEIRESNFWKTWLKDESLELTITYRSNVTVQSYYSGQAIFEVKITLDDLRTELDDPLTLDEWDVADGKTMQSDIDENVELRDFLKTATMKDLAERDDLVLESDHGSESFSAMARRHLGNGLALDLIAAGYIDRNFSLYVSLYYDDTVTAKARNYILHSVESGAVDINAEIGTGRQIEALLDEVGDRIFAERSIYNIQLLDHLLASGDVRLDRSMRLIGGDTQEDAAIRTAYFSSGHEQTALVSRLGPNWPGILDFLVTDDSVAEAERADLLDTALSVISPTNRYVATPAMREFIQANYLKMKTLTGERTVYSLETVAAILKETDVTFDSLSLVSEALRPLVIRDSLYRLTEANLTEATGGTDLALDILRAADENVFDHAVANLSTYLDIQENAESTTYTIASYKNFTTVLNKLANKDSNEVRKVAERSSGVSVKKITNLNEKLWPIVAQTKKLAPSYSNIAAYLEKRGHVDDQLAATLNFADKITSLEAVDEPDKSSLALTLLTTDRLNYQKRVELAASLGVVTPLPIGELHLEDHDEGMAGAVLNAGLVEDSAVAFESLGTMRWPIKSSYIRASEHFAEYIRSIGFSTDDFAALAQDPSLPDGIRKAVVLHLDDFRSATGRVALDALARFAVARSLAVGPSNLTVMASTGVDPSLLVQLIVLELDAITAEELLSILRLMPDKYRKLTTTGGQTKLPLTDADLRLADHLVDVHQVSSREPKPSGAEFKVNLRRI